MTTHRTLNLKTSLLIMPTLLTLAAAVCAFYSILLASQANRGADLGMAGYLIALAAFLDGIDGRVARLTRTESAFGERLDSLSDMIAFGLAPAWLAYHWGLYELGLAGFLVAFVFVAATAFRLARFNVLSSLSYDPRYFVGLPSPAAALLIAGLVIVHTMYLNQFHITGSSQGLVALATILVGLLMVSKIRFRSHRKWQVTRRSGLLVFALFSGMTYVGIETRLEVGLFAGVVAYVAYCLVVAAIVWARRIFEGVASSGDASADLVLEESSKLGDDNELARP